MNGTSQIKKRGGTVHKREMFFAPANANRTLHIWLPAGYEGTAERYPVMYFFDGHNLFDDGDATYGTCWGLRDFLRTWEKQIIVVGIECSHEGNNRLKEYCPYHVKSDYFGEVDGIGAATIDWIVNEIKPMMDKEYRTYSFREATGIAGSSMGGLMSLYAVLHHNKVFSKAACVSSAIKESVPNLLKEIEEHEISADTRVYMSWGTAEGDWHEDRVGQMQKAIEGCGARVRVFKQEGGRHCEADWSKQNRNYLDFLWLNR